MFAIDNQTLKHYEPLPNYIYSRHANLFLIPAFIYVYRRLQVIVAKER